MKKQVLSATALLLLSAALLACGEEAGTPKTTDSTEVQTEAVTEENPLAILDHMKDLDFGGKSLRIDISVNDNEWSTSSVYVKGPDKEVGDTVQDMVYNRNRDIAELLNLKVEWNTSNLAWGDVEGYVEKQVLSGTDDVDLFINDQLGLTNDMAKGYLFNLKNEDQYKSYFDFNSDGWYNTYMDQLSLLADKRYFLVGDYFMDTIRAAHVTYFNKKTMESDFEGADEIYNLVDTGKWTMDKYLEYINAAYKDINGNGQVDAEDSYGLFFNKCYLYYYVSDADSVKWTAEGATFDVDVERGSAIVDKILLLCESIGRRNDPNNCSHATIKEMFCNGRLLFTYWLKLADMEDAAMRDMDGVGIIPYPKLDESQKGYITQIHDTAEIGAVPTTVSMENLSMLSAYLQAMTEYSAKYVMPEYYETALKVKYSQDQQSARMLNIIRESINDPCDIAYNGLLKNIVTDPVTNSSSKGTNVYASSVEQKMKSATAAWEALIEKLKSYD